VGGTVGDIESQPFLEAIRQFRQDVGRAHTLYVHLTLVPFIGAAGELKTKPTQHSVRDLRSLGIQPDILLCRTDRFLPAEIRRKIALFCDVDEDAVITAKDVSSIYEVPLVLGDEGLDRNILRRLQLPDSQRKVQEWQKLVDGIRHPTDRLKIHIVGKYVGYEDSYKSLNEALYHGGFQHRLEVEIEWVEAEALEAEALEAEALEAEALEAEDGAHLLAGADGVLVPGGFGDRGSRGMMRAARIAREGQIPYFGICYGFQWAAVEFARNMCGLEGGGTMRLGTYPCHLTPGSLVHRIYGTDEIRERHRHRYEFNRAYERVLHDHGLVISGQSPDGQFVETIELPAHPWFVAVQFHPEFRSKPLTPHPLFADFVRASYEHKVAARTATASAVTHQP
jgi:CTP synthase